ncbi:MAG TPA: MFS transporter [Burkholderiaceae bacterium]|jgi:MFS family permease/quinol monooxygenase YgiN|nr:MFS transporter [Burkholderiaceae bacterium]HQR72288.1 MFS transporter [Burkholderiaceae bacterium]
MTGTQSASAAHSAWSPLANPVFRLLWITWLTSNVCMWMNDVAAAWMMTSLTTSPVMVALVQSASTLPVFLLGLPSGALADILNRRHWFMFTQFWVATNAVLLSVVVFGGWMTAPLLLVLTFGNGIGLAMRWPVYAAIIPELVTRRELPNAIALNGIAMNTSRVIGPVLAGALIASLGTGFVFLLNAVLSLAAGFVIMRWRSEPKPSVLPGERFIGAMRVGFQYVAQSRAMRSVLLRVACFFLQTTTVFALLPLVARRLPGGGAWTYTILLASLGIGAVAAAFFLPRLRVLISRHRLLRDGTVLQAAAMVALGFAPNVWAAVPAMMIAGAAWLSVVNTLTVVTQLSLPDWVRARGMSIYMMTMMGAASASAALWGQVASWIDVPFTYVAAALAGLAASFLASRLYADPEDEVDLTPARILEEPVPAFPVEHRMGPVMVTVDYQIDPARAEEFAAVMRESRANRLQKGALSWGLFHDTNKPGHYIEYFLDESWAEHLRRFDRFTAADAELRERRYSFHLGASAPVVSRYIAEPLGK